MSIPQFTATKGGKSATFRLMNMDHRIDGTKEVTEIIDDEEVTTIVEGNDRLIFYPEYGVVDPFDGSSIKWIKNQGDWPDKIRAAKRVFDADAQADAVAALGAELDGKSSFQRTFMICVKCFDTANGTSSTINWGD